MSVVDLHIEGTVATVVLNRPEKLNALNDEMRALLLEHFTRLKHDDAVRAIIVTGAGTAFCSGADVGNMGQSDLRARRQRIQRGAHAYIAMLHSIEKPVIAAVRGAAVGVGWSVAMACDLIVASETARFSQIFRRIGLGPDGGAAWFLAQRIPMPLAKELIFSGRMIDAHEALSMGLVNHVVPDSDLMAKAEAMAAEYAAGPTFALGLAKKLLHVAASTSLGEFLEMESMTQPQLQVSADHAEGVAAFKEKRKPRFSGR
jgi:2-(1,2-epoxy-1,2-dihydrophenyl)acetyl-CoA isomerase